MAGTKQPTVEHLARGGGPCCVFLQRVQAALLFLMEQSAAVNGSDSIELSTRYLVEVPDAFAQRVQAALPFLMSLQSGAGAAFLLPALLRAADAPDASAPEEAAEHVAWLQALRRPQVRFSHTQKQVLACV